MLLFELGRQAEARSVLAQGVAQNPANPQLCMEWALAEQAAGNLGEAPPLPRPALAALNARAAPCSARRVPPPASPAGLHQAGRGRHARDRLLLPRAAAHSPHWRLPPAPRAEDALQIFEQGAAAPDPHAPLLAGWAALARRMGRVELAADIQRRLDALQGGGQAR